jgi:hypothetical protein
MSLPTSFTIGPKPLASRVSEMMENVDLRGTSEAMRQRLIDLAMMEPPLVDVDADRVFLTAAGREAERVG